ncbi:MAG: YceD family protein [Pseudomonadota bacterium]
MSVALTEPVDVRQDAARGRRIDARLSLSQLPRLVELQHDDAAQDAPVAVQLTLDLDASERVLLAGRVTAALTLACERCLGPVEHSLDLALSLKSGELPEGDFSADEGPVRLADVIEDELLLALAGGVRHEAEEACAPDATRYLADEGEAAPTMRTPFAGLKDLLDKGE